MIRWLRGERDRLPDPRLLSPSHDGVPGLVAAGGRLSPDRLEEAYRKGIFPWYSEGQPVLWWSPDPRMVLFVDEFNLTRSLRKTLKRFAGRADCAVRIDTAFARVIETCASMPRDGEAGTWIVPDMIDAYRAWHERGRVHSVETWVDGELVGGLYGVGIGRMFFGESMFAHRTDASKVALAALVAFCRRHGIAMIDCQQKTAHLASLGAREIPRDDFLRRVGTALAMNDVDDWSYDLRSWDALGVRPTTSGDRGS